MCIENKKKRKKLTQFSRNQLLNLLELLFWFSNACINHRNKKRIKNDILQRRQPVGCFFVVEMGIV